MNLSPQEFVAKWRGVTLKERSASQSHFNDLCRLVGHPTPIEADPTGKWFTFEAGANKSSGGQGWADVWMRSHFAWEYKGKHADLDKAYQQLLLYREALENPPLLIVSDLDRIVIHPNFTNMVKQAITLTLDDLLTPDGLRKLKAVFFEPDIFKSPQTTEAVTRQAAQDFAHLADLLRKQGHEPNKIAHFLIRLLFCLFAEDISLLPDSIFSKMVQRTRMTPDQFTGLVRQLFGVMATGGWFGMERIDHFNGGLFDDDSVLPLNYDGMDILARVCRLDWSSIEPSIFGTLFERSLDPSKRSQLGAHYTSKEDILLIVEPVLMAPLRRKWAEVQAQARDLASKRDQAGSRSAASRYANELEKLLRDFADELAVVRVLDPACGSANFLYVSLRQLLDLWKEVALLGAELGLTMMSPLAGAPSPSQLYGIEINPYAHELAQATIWIGWIQWLNENGYGTPSEPILKPLDNIKNMDAVLAFDEGGRPYEPEWPEADVIVGNPPFLGDKRMRSELGDEYVESLRSLYHGRVPGGADFVTYWFERARELLGKDGLQRAGLLSTNSIRFGANRSVLERIKSSSDIFLAWSDRAWVLDGAAVRVSIVGFGFVGGMEKMLDGETVGQINPDLTASADVTKAVSLGENQGIAYIGTQKSGAFDVDAATAQWLISQGGNPNGRSNRQVVRRWVNATDITGRARNMWIIFFGANTPLVEAAQYEAPFEYVVKNVKPERDKSRDTNSRESWWLLARPRPAMYEAFGVLTRYIATPRVAKHRLFVFLDLDTVPDSRVVAIARDDDYFMGVLHSSLHELWSIGTASRHGVGNDPTYNAQSCFETFPFPWPPSTEPTDDPRVQAIAQAAKELVEYRDNWLNPTGVSESELKKRTLTNLYNLMPTWLKMAHEKLDKAVFDAYGWPHDLSDEEILARLLALNLERAAGERLV